MTETEKSAEQKALDEELETARRATELARRGHDLDRIPADDAPATAKSRKEGGHGSA